MLALIVEGPLDVYVLIVRQRWEKKLPSGVQRRFFFHLDWFWTKLEYAAFFFLKITFCRHCINDHYFLTDNLSWKSSFSGPFYFSHQEMVIRSSFGGSGRSVTIITVAEWLLVRKNCPFLDKHQKITGQSRKVCGNKAFTIRADWFRSSAWQLSLQGGFWEVGQEASLLKLTNCSFKGAIRKTFTVLNS